MNSGRPHRPGSQASAGSPEVTLAPDARGRDLELAARFGVTLGERRDSTAWQIVRSSANLALCAPRSEGGYRVQIDPATGALATRLRTARRTDALPRAIGLGRPGAPPRVVDGTAGLGRDAMVLAHLGCEVTAVERVPAFALLLQDAVDRQPGLALHVVCADAVAWLGALPDDAAPSVVYLDPMFERTGKAQVKKEMQAARALAGTPEDPAALLRAARAVATERVVVKRHPDLPPVAADVAHRVGGERVRFDVYLTR